MTAIRTTCPTCGVVEVGSTDILLTYDDQEGEGMYQFECPSCHEIIEKDADSKIAAVLRSVDVAEDRPDQRPIYPEHYENATPITKAEIAEFILDLHNEDYLAEQV